MLLMKFNNDCIIWPLWNSISVMSEAGSFKYTALLIQWNEKLKIMAYKYNYMTQHRRERVITCISEDKWNWGAWTTNSGTGWGLMALESPDSSTTGPLLLSTWSFSTSFSFSSILEEKYLGATWPNFWTNKKSLLRYPYVPCTLKQKYYHWAMQHKVLHWAHGTFHRKCCETSTVRVEASS